MHWQMGLTSERRRPGPRADRRHQGIDLSGGDTLDPGLNDHGILGLIDPPPVLQDCREETPSAVLLLRKSLQLGDRKRDVAHLVGEQAGSTAVAVATALVSALAQHGGDFQLDQLLQAVAGQVGNQLPGRAVIK